MSNPARKRQPAVLTIAGFDPSGRAGIMADIQTIQSFGCVPVAAITSVTSQNSKTFFGAIHQTGNALRSQVRAVTGDIQIDAVKIGMVPTIELVREVVKLIEELSLPAPVLDPVLRSTTGHRLIEEDAIDVLLNELMPLSRLVTPNVPEAQRLTGLKITSEAQMHEAAAKLRGMGARAVLIKGGHLGTHAPEASGQSSAEEEVVDVLNEEGSVTVFRAARITGSELRGTGCILSSAIAASLAQKKSLAESVQAGKDHVADRIRQAQQRPL